MRILFSILFVLLPTLAQAAPADDIWMSVLLDGRKIGHMHTTRAIRDGSVITSQKMEVELDRAGVKVGLSTGETDAETMDGEAGKIKKAGRTAGSLQANSVFPPCRAARGGILARRARTILSFPDIPKELQ